MQENREDCQGMSQTEVNYQQLLRENVSNAGFNTHQTDNETPLNPENTQQSDEDSNTADSPMEPELNKSETQPLHIPPSNESEHINVSGSRPEHVSVIGAILRIMGDEQYSRTCGKHLRFMGDEIYYIYAARKLIPHLLEKLNSDEPVYNY